MNSPEWGGGSSPGKNGASPDWIIVVVVCVLLLLLLLLLLLFLTRAFNEMSMATTSERSLCRTRRHLTESEKCHEWRKPLCRVTWESRLLGTPALHLCLTQEANSSRRCTNSEPSDCQIRRVRGSDVQKTAWTPQATGAPSGHTSPFAPGAEQEVTSGTEHTITLKMCEKTAKPP